MKKIVLFFVLFFSFSLISCENNEEPETIFYSVTYNMNGHGNEIQSQELEYLPEDLPTPSEDGYEFGGWFFDSDCVNQCKPGMKLTSNITLYAKWTDIRVIISFETFGKGNLPEPMLVGSIPDELPVLEEEDYTFGGWYYDSDCVNQCKPGTNLSSNITLYAKWTDIRVELSFEPFRKGYLPEAMLVSSIPDELPVLEEEDYTFGGWYYDSEFKNKANSGDKLLTDTKLYAKWSLTTYKITYVTNGHGDDIIVDELLFIPDDLLELKDDGYTFDGWYLDGEFSTRVESGVEMSSDITLYAKWLEQSRDFSSQKEEERYNLSATGYLAGKITDFSQYENTNAYVKVTNAKELAEALYNAKYDYTNNWNSETNKVEQVLNKEGTVHVIEIMNDINLGYNVIANDAKSNGIITNYIKSGQTPTSKMVIENGISQIKVENISNLLIYSKCGAKLTHAGFKLTSCHNVVFRNLEMDEMWEWEDSNSKTPQKIGDYDKFGWAYFKISHCGQIWIDHMTFGKSYDGQIDYANPVSNTEKTKFRLAYGSDGTNGLHISFCDFNAGSDDKDGYLYKMMDAIEEEYKVGKSNYLYYNALRDSGITFDEILYGLAIPQKKGFLLGDNADYASDDYNYNLQMKVSFSSCKFMNFQDRIPKIRGGNVYMYNCIADSSQYYSYRSILKEKNADGAVKSVNSSWKAALVSQGIVVGSGGYAHIENTMYKGIAELVKNNDNIASNTGYIDLMNFSAQVSNEQDAMVGSTRGDKPEFNYSWPSLCVPDTMWPKENGIPPFQIYKIQLNKLEEYLNNPIFGVGIRKDIPCWLKVNY